MTITARKAHHVGQSRHRDGCDAVGGGAVAQLSSTIEAPGAHGAVRFQGQTVSAAARKAHHVGQSRNRNGRSAAAGGAVAQLSITVEAPTAHGAVRFQGQTVIPAARQGDTLRRDPHHGLTQQRRTGIRRAKCSAIHLQGMVAQ